MPSINVDGAAKRLLANSSLAKAGYCLFYVWGAISQGRVHFITGGADTAYNTWLAAPARNRHASRTVPKDFPAFLGPRFGSSAGDVIISNGDGTFAATDWPSNRRTGSCTLEQREAQTGRHYEGWADSMGGYDLVSASTAGDTISPLTPDLPVKKKEVDMSHPTGVVYQIVNPAGGLAGVKVVIGARFAVLGNDGIAAFYTGFLNHGLDEFPDFDAANPHAPLPISQDNAELASQAFGPTLPGGTVATLWGRAKTDANVATYSA